MKAENKKLVIGVLAAAAVLFVGFVSYNFYQSLKNGLVAGYVSQTTAVVSGKDILLVEDKENSSPKAIFDGYRATKYKKNGQVETGTFYFNGNYNPDEKTEKVTLWRILFVNH